MTATRTAVLIPVLNDREGLFRSLASIASEESILVVVVDDGSNPPVVSADIYRHLAHRHTAHLIRHEVNQGIVAALNHGLAACRDRDITYIARLDAGDSCVGDRLNKQVEFLNSHPEYTLVGGQAEVMDQHGVRRYKLNLPTDDKSIRKAMHMNSAFVHPAVMMRADTLWRMREWYSGRYLWAEDYDLFYRLLSLGKAANLPATVLAKYDTRDSVSVRNRRRQLLSRLRIQCRQFALLTPHSWIGILKTLCLFATPSRLLNRYRKAFWQ